MVVRRFAPRVTRLNHFAPSGAFTLSYFADRPNTCPACARSNWIIGRISAECGFCGTALPIAAPIQSAFMPVKQAA